MHGTESDLKGEGTLSGQMFASLYAELRRIAAAQIARSGPQSTLQPTALVHEAWLRLGTRNDAPWHDQSHFVASAAATMRHVIVDHARRRHAVRHGAGQRPVDISQLDLASLPGDDESLLAVDAALTRLALRHPDAAALIELHCFGRLELPEAARLLGLSRATVYRRWLFAQAWLHKELAAV